MTSIRGFTAYDGIQIDDEGVKYRPEKPLTVRNSQEQQGKQAEQEYAKQCAQAWKTLLEGCKDEKIQKQLAKMVNKKDRNQLL